jgi:eukaryotic-like serine/threonine-protein kinase
VGPSEKSAKDELEATVPSAEFSPEELAGPDVPAPGQTVGRFVVVKPLGAGAMGLVLAAYDPALDRKVALKLVQQDASSDSAGRQRLLREAQAMARLSHPSVVTVFEVGTLTDAVFLAMEHVDGCTLREWLAAQKRSWRAVLSLFAAAGRGLAAAHAAGIVHRDFKPDNVLVGADGRVRVGDFGLASAPPRHRFSATTAAVAPARDTIPEITQEGSLIGTPLYMSPEQHRGKPADARSDQFSFCVTLYEALYGHSPFAGENYRYYAAQVLGGRVRPAPRGATVPAWLRAVLLRGLATEPEARFPSMNALLDALARDPAARRRRIAVALGVAVLAAAGVYALIASQGSTAAAPCASSDDSMAGAWDQNVRDRVAAAFAASARPGARDSLRRVERALGQRAGALTAMRRDACEATHVRGEQSHELFDRRIHCLDRQVSELRAMTGLLARADDEMVDRSVEAVLGLGPVSACADAAALTAAVPPPADPALRARVAAVRRSLVDAGALAAAGKVAPALSAARAASKQSAAIGHAPLRAEALARQAELELRTGDTDAARRSFEAAIGAAGAARDDGILARAVVQLFDVVGGSQKQFDQAAALLPVARAAVARAGAGAELRALLEGAIGRVALTEGRFKDAVDAFRRSLAAIESVRGAGDLALAAALDHLGQASARLGRHAEALAAFERALAIREASLGSDHALVADSLDSVGRALADLDRHREALERQRRALAIRDKQNRPDRPEMTPALLDLAVAEFEAGRPAEGRALYRRALAMWERSRDRAHPRVLGALRDLGRAELAARQAGSAALLLERALDGYRAGDKARRDDVPAVRMALADALWRANRAGDRGRAREQMKAAAKQLASSGRARDAARARRWLSVHRQRR